MKTVLKVVLGLLLAGTSFSSSSATAADPYKYAPNGLAEPAPIKYNGAEEVDEEDEDEAPLEGSGRSLRPRRSRSKPRYSGSRSSRRGTRKITNYSGKRARVTRRGSSRSSIRVNVGSRS